MSTPRSPRHNLVSAWLRKSKSDLIVARKVLAEPDPQPEQAVYHCQQAVEKIKAFLVLRGQTFPKTHDLEELKQLAVPFDPDLAPFLDQASYMTDYSWQHRYPSESPEPNTEEAEAALAIAKAVYEAISAHVPEDTR